MLEDSWGSVYWLLWVIIVYIILFPAKLPFIWTMRSIFYIIVGWFDRMFFNSDPCIFYRFIHSVFSRIWGICWFEDVDTKFHMKETAILQFFDFGRYAFGSKCVGIIEMFVDFHIVGSLHCQFYEPVYPFEIFWIETKVIFVDRKWWLVEQKFITKTGVHCVSLVKMIFKQKCGKTIYSYEAQPTISHPYDGEKKLDDAWLRLESYRGEFIDNNYIGDTETPRTPITPVIPIPPMTPVVFEQKL